MGLFHDVPIYMGHGTPVIGYWWMAQLAIWWVAHVILASAPVPLELIGVLYWVGVRPRGLGPGLDNSRTDHIRVSFKNRDELHFPALVENRSRYR